MTRQATDRTGIPNHPRTKAVVNQSGDNCFDLYEESGQAIEVDFTSQEEAEKYAENNDYEIVVYFNL